MSAFFYIHEKLSIADVEHILSHQLQLKLMQSAIDKITQCRAFLDTKLDGNDNAYYGINTGFGALYNTKISKNQLSQLQENLLLSHACGTGDTVPTEIVRLMLLLKIQSLSYGYSAVQLKTVETLITLFNNNVLPVVFEQGSLGASGDLAPLAHLCLPLLGKGKVWVQQEQNWVQQDSAIALTTIGIEPIVLQSKEGLALINGTQFMSAFGLYILLKSRKLWKWSNLIAAVSLEGYDGRIEPFHESLHRIRPHKGQVATAAEITELLQQSEIIAQPKQHVQDPYAFRCIPQVHGASFDTLNHVAQVLQTEIESVTDNPNVFPEEDLILSGGNFHGQPLALVLDFMAIALAELGSISERRTYQLISGQRGLPPFLVANAGLNSGFMIPQYTAASIVSQNKQLCTPASVDSIVSSNGQEDHVSMGANAATKCLRVVNNVETILAIELMNAAQAIAFRKPFKSTEAIEALLLAYREKISFVEEDRYLHPDILESVAFLRTYQNGLSWNY